MWLIQITPERVSCWDKNHRTNNSCESLHSRLNKGIRGFPKFWAYPEKIKAVFDRTVQDFHRLQAGLRVTRVRPPTKVELAIRKYSEDFRQDGDIPRFIKRCRYLAHKSERVVEVEGEEEEVLTQEEEVLAQEEELLAQEEVPAQEEEEVLAQEVPTTPVSQQQPGPSTPGTVPARRTRARRRLNTAAELLPASQPVER